MANFSKKLSKTDIQKRLSVPTRYLSSLPSFNGDHAVDIQAVDERGDVWTFKCSIRKLRQYPKPVLSKGWLAFVDSKSLKVGDRIRFYKKKTNKDGTTHAYKIRAEKGIKIFGAVFGYAPVIAPHP